MTSSISAIIPTWQEGRAIDACIASCWAVADEVIVVDAGSTDQTPEIARRAGAKLLCASKGRGPQLNAGARHASCDVLLFVHADTQVPAAARAAIQQATAQGNVGGNFKLRFVPETTAGRVYAHANHLRRRIFRLYYGDSCIFVRRSVFEELGGFADLPIFEDHDFVRRLERLGTTRYETSVTVATSSRRFEKNPIRTLALWGTLQLLYGSGVSAHRLGRLYADLR